MARDETVSDSGLPDTALPPREYLTIAPLLSPHSDRRFSAKHGRCDAYASGGCSDDANGADASGAKPGDDDDVDSVDAIHAPRQGGSQKRTPQTKMTRPLSRARMKNRMIDAALCE
jgi:hypothetical protein